MGFRFLVTCLLLLLLAQTGWAQVIIDKRIMQSPEPRPLAIDRLKTNLTVEQRIALKPKYPVIKPKTPTEYEGKRRSQVIVKFVDGARIREDNFSSVRLEKTDKTVLHKRLDDLKIGVSKLDAYDRDLLKRKQLTAKKAGRQMAQFRKIVKQYKIKQWRKVFQRIDQSLLDKLRLNVEVNKRRQASDMGNYFVILLQQGQPGEKLVDELNKLDIVELAYLAPIVKTPDVPPITPSFIGQQDYLNAAPQGIDARYAWTIPGGKGFQVKIIDVEKGWNLTHEDLPSMFIVDGKNETDDSRQHGTAVMSIMLGLEDGAGVTGIVPRAVGGVVSARRGLGLAYFDNVAEAVLIAAANLSEGDVMLIEQHAKGPKKNLDCTCASNCGYIAVEYWNDVFDAVNAATASGIVVVAAAGNGEASLDHSRYKDRFNRTVRNSGAIFVGAGESSTRKPKCFSNHGSRLDLQGWGENVMAAGYGDSDTYKIDGGDDNQWYTTSFSGTSSATPIVAGAVAAIQGIQLENNNPALDWYEMKELLISTGTPQSGSKQIGPLPDLQAAITTLVADQPPSPEDAVYEYEVTMGEELLDANRNVSGFSGDRTRTIGVAGERLAIERLKFGERSDRGCFAQAEKADIVTRAIEKPHANVDFCGSKGPKDNSIKYVPLLTTDHDTFIHGVSVCNSKTKNSERLKGVKVYRTRIEDDGSFSRISNPSTMERPNCDGNWRTPAECPANSVATKLVVHIRDEKKDEIITGLSLKCKEVQVIRTCLSGC